ncbi:T9SS type A sorting domain-containing protein [Epilithonimonas arachidiradicis]|uniref:Putative secreted protein (Por secretion system target) n=1 Tax=Epilithonimonas arachidiradicis TaxID=1617282 RepID=A0A420DAQ3_9FLAO|nr:T9SS type A sorting domain-containing protein [Epilithonimonas arachidiradicis]RKE87826.1 putative secreted protein (Por secretion system target) [Epilithonimonas arachidiradicis]GGG58193.1 hypothetical protein GCM10007332_19920 [Epilithonimonas arachidiradicis]
MKKIFTILSVAAVSLVSAQNLITNPGFENDLTGWAKGPTAAYTAPTISSDAHTGAKSAAYIGATATTGFFQTVPVTAGKTYVIEFWYKSSGDDTDSRLWSVFRDSGGAAVYTTTDATTDPFRTNNLYLPSASAWTKYTAEMPAGTGAVSLEVAFRVYNGGSGIFDDVMAYDKASMAVSDVAGFDKAVQFNTIVKDQITFKLPVKSTVNIYSAEGKLISSNRVENGGSVNTQSLVKGAYIVTVDNGANKISRKVIKN